MGVLTVCLRTHAPVNHVTAAVLECRHQTGLSLSAVCKSTISGAKKRRFVIGVIGTPVTGRSMRSASPSDTSADWRGTESYYRAIRNQEEGSMTDKEENSAADRMSRGVSVLAVLAVGALL
jgi:hypothetical protein